MKLLQNTAVLALLAVGFAACSSGQSAIEPPFTGAPVASTSTLQFAPGVATIATAAATATTGFNAVATLRNPAGNTAALYNTPTIFGPAGFVANAPTPPGNIDSGTNHFSGTPAQQAGTVPPPSTFGSGTNAGAQPVGTSSSTGVTGYGLMPTNSNTSGSAFFTPLTLPFFATAGVGIRWIGGPPAFPNVRNGTYPPGYRGFTEGFTDFQGTTPTAGVYTLSVLVPTGFDNNGNPTTATLATSASITSAAPLPIFTRPVFTPNGTGGGTIAYVLPAGVTEAYLQVRNNTTKCYPSGAGAAPAYFTVRVTPTSANPAVLPDNMGETSATQSSTHTLCTGAESGGTGDSYTVYAAGFDWPAFASAYPQSNGIANPPITTTGQDDVTTSFPQTLTYP